MINFFCKENYSFEDLLEIMRILRSDCPWDREQTHASIRRNLLEEAYEAAEAIDLNDASLLCEELGDVLLQVVFHAQMSEESGGFDIAAVTDGVCKKLIVRHPHIFGEVRAETSGEVLSNWENIKNETKGHKSHADAVNSVARSLPALMRAEKVQQRAKKAGFDWPDINGPLSKLDEERHELDCAMSSGTGIEEELGDLLFAIVNVARFLKVDPERALEKASDKFARRFAKVEELAAAEGLSMPGTSIDELDRLWDKIK